MDLQLAHIHVLTIRRLNGQYTTWLPRDKWRPIDRLVANIPMCTDRGGPFGLILGVL